MTTSITAKSVRAAFFADNLRADYPIKASLLRRQPAETVEDIMGYCLDATDEIPAGGIVQVSAGPWGIFPSETVPR